MVRLINSLIWSSIYFQIQLFQYYILRMLANAVVLTTYPSVKSFKQGLYLARRRHSSGFFPPPKHRFSCFPCLEWRFLLGRPELGTLGLIDHNKTVGHLDSGKVAGSMESESESEIWEVVGELKQHGNILIREWKGINAKTDITMGLGREIRA